MTTINIETGSEGPMHDPYGYEEITVTRSNGDEVMLHAGLDLYVLLPGKRRFSVVGYDEAHAWTQVSAKFEEFAGCTPAVARKAYEHVRAMCSTCNRITPTYFQAGYPGETFEMCCICDNVVNCDFNEAAII